MLDKQCISLQYNRITTNLKAQIESISGKYNFIFGSSGCWIIKWCWVPPKHLMTPPRLGRSFTTVSEEIPVVPVMLLALGSHCCPNTNAGQGFPVATCYCTEKSVLGQTLMAKKVWDQPLNSGLALTWSIKAC